MKSIQNNKNKIQIYKHLHIQSTVLNIVIKLNTNNNGTSRKKISGRN